MRYDSTGSAIGFGILAAVFTTLGSTVLLFAGTSGRFE